MLFNGLFTRTFFLASHWHKSNCKSCLLKIASTKEFAKNGVPFDTTGSNKNPRFSFPFREFFHQLLHPTLASVELLHFFSLSPNFLVLGISGHLAYTSFHPITNSHLLGNFWSYPKCLQTCFCLGLAIKRFYWPQN